MPPSKPKLGRDVIAAFDFDGTLTTRDSFLRFLMFERACVQMVTDLTVTLPLLLLYAARLVENDTHKMALFARQFTGISNKAFHLRAERFAHSELPKLLRAEALRRVSYHQELGHRVIIVTASFPEWITPWAKTVGIVEVLGSRAEIYDGKLTGRLAGKNCHGPEKLRRLLALHPERTSYQLFAYGDSRGDHELLAAADEAFYRRFK